MRLSLKAVRFCLYHDRLVEIYAPLVFCTAHHAAVARARGPDTITMVYQVNGTARGLVPHDHAFVYSFGGRPSQPKQISPVFPPS
jgi:hypothetical protein